SLSVRDPRSGVAKIVDSCEGAPDGERVPPCSPTSARFSATSTTSRGGRRPPPGGTSGGIDPTAPGPPGWCPYRCPLTRFLRPAGIIRNDLVPHTAARVRDRVSATGSAYR